MAKWYSESQMIGERGETLAQLAALEMGFLYNRTGMDAGIDGEIEIRDPVTKAATNQVIRVQSKATDGAFPKETEQSFEFSCKGRDLDYWLSSNTPVLLVCSRPRTGEAYWVCLQDYFDTAEKRKSRRVVFDKQSDKFDSSARDRLVELARDRKAGLYINPVPVPETLYSNLLHVSRMPETVYSAKTSYRKAGPLIGKAKELGVMLDRGWALKDGKIYSFLDLSQAPWTHFCEGETVMDDPAEVFAHSDDLDSRNLFSWLLRSHLEQLLWERGVRFDRPMGHFHFMSPRDLRIIKKIDYTTHKGNRSVMTVFQKHQWKTGAGADRHYYRHNAFAGQFEYFGCEWYLRIIPTYRYTSNGFDLDRFYESHLSGMKKQEKNRSVLSQIELWAHIISHGSEDDGMFKEHPIMEFGQLLELEMPVGINDSVWKAKAGGDEKPGGFEVVFQSHADAN